MLTIKYKNKQSLETTHNADPVLCLSGWHDWRHEKNNEWFWTAPWWLPAVIATYLCWNSFFLLTLSDTIICACSRRSIFCRSSKKAKQMPWSLTFTMWTYNPSSKNNLSRDSNSYCQAYYHILCIFRYGLCKCACRHKCVCVCCCWTEYHKTLRNSADPPCTTGKGRDRTSAGTTWHSPPCTKESGRTSADTTWHPVQEEKKVTAIQLIKWDTLHPVQEESDSNSAD